MRSKSIIQAEENLNLFILSSSPDIEDTPGVISTVLHLLAAEGINVHEFISSYTDTLLVIREADTSRAYELLSALTK
ncbi:ACT domain protein [uncultured archaeon]|nr:ACT domain protein [uncultured archaeon]